MRMTLERAQRIRGTTRWTGGKCTPTLDRCVRRLRATVRERPAGDQALKFAGSTGQVRLTETLSWRHGSNAGAREGSNGRETKAVIVPAGASQPYRDR